MQKQFIHAGTRIFKNQNGNILLLTAFMMIIIAVLLAGLVDFGRVLIVREQLQTAADSAALAGASSGTHRYVKINVVTDRGQREVCGKDSCWCTGCGTVTIRGIMGDEKELIDNGGWREYCIPPCDCGGGECQFQVISRDVTYDTQSMSWGTSAAEISNIENDLTEVSREVISQYLYTHTPTVKNMLSGQSLPSIYQIVSNSYAWNQRWMAAGGFSPDCGSYHYRYGPVAKCLAWQQVGNEQFNKLNTAKPGNRTKAQVVKQLIDNIATIKAANSRVVTKVGPQYEGAVGKFFEANLPKNADDSMIRKIKVYSYNHGNAQSPYYPSVIVYASSTIKPIFQQWIKNNISTIVCAQGTTSYRDANDSSISGLRTTVITNGKWKKVPDKACWVDWP